MSTHASDRDKMQVYLNAVLDAEREEDKRFIGIYSVDPLKCNKSHRRANRCPYCRWNLCQACSSDKPMCPACKSEDDVCIATCIFFAKIRFYGWSAICVDCYRTGVSFPDNVPADWKLMFPEPQPPQDPVPQGRSAADVIIIDDDDPVAAPPPDSPRTAERRLMATETCKNLSPYWDFTIDFMSAPQLITIFELDDNTISPEEVWEVRKLLHAGERRCETAGPAPIAFPEAKKPKFKVITSIRRVQNWESETRYAAAVHIVETHNKILTRQFQNKDISKDQFDAGYAKPIERVVFHGTSVQNAEDICLDGIIQSRNTVGAYGRGFYCSEPTGSAEHYAQARCMRNQEMVHCMIMGFGVIGRNGFSYHGNDRPQPGFHSGGNNTPWIYTLFKADQFVARYIIEYKLADEQKHLEQIETMKTAAQGGVVDVVSAVPQSAVVPVAFVVDSTSSATAAVPTSSAAASSASPALPTSAPDPSASVVSPFPVIPASTFSGIVKMLASQAGKKKKRRTSSLRFTPKRPSKRTSNSPLDSPPSSPTAGQSSGSQQPSGSQSPPALPAMVQFQSIAASFIAASGSPAAASGSSGAPAASGTPSTDLAASGAAAVVPTASAPTTAQDDDSDDSSEPSDDDTADWRRPGDEKFWGAKKRIAKAGSRRSKK